VTLSNEVKADGKVYGWVKLSADFFCQVFLKRRLVLLKKPPENGTIPTTW
jgi:hypothetical protein